MLAKLRNSVTVIGFAAAAGLLLPGCSKSEESGARFTPIGEEKEVRGKVAEAKLTVCGTTPNKPGTCEGTLLVEPPGSGAAGRVPVEVTRDVVLKVSGQTVFLPQLRDSQVTVKYRASKEGPNVATSVLAQ